MVLLFGCFGYGQILPLTNIYWDEASILLYLDLEVLIERNHVTETKLKGTCKGTWNV